jgi:hypothetical protein
LSLAVQTLTRLLAWSDRSCQTAVVNAVVIVPQWLAQLDSATQNFDLLLRSSRRISWQEVTVNDRIKVLVVSILQNRFKYVLAQIAHCVAHLFQGKRTMPPTMGKNCPIFHTVSDYFQLASKVKKITERYFAPCLSIPRPAAQANLDEAGRAG